RDDETTAEEAIGQGGGRKRRRRPARGRRCGRRDAASIRNERGDDPDRDEGRETRGEPGRAPAPREKDDHGGDRDARADAGKMHRRQARSTSTTDPVEHERRGIHESEGARHTTRETQEEEGGTPGCHGHGGRGERADQEGDEEPAAAGG